MWHHPNFDPILLQIGPIAIRWYGLAYIIGLLAGTQAIRSRLQSRFSLSSDDILGFMSALMIGVLLGGRFGYILFYNLPYYLHHPAQVLAIWQGGMSYHGGAIGAMMGIILFAKQHRKPFLGLLDLLAMGSTLAIFFGRLANFINQELVGRITTMPWGVIYSEHGDLPRHPSQLYEAIGEGLLLYLILEFMDRKFPLKPGQLFAIYLLGYGVIRFGLEFFREPDVQIGLIWETLTMGQLLCALMIGLGCGLFFIQGKRRS